MKKFLALALAFIMVFALATSAFAQEKDSGAGGSATITVNNAAKGETYAVYKLFDATVTGAENGAIAYSGVIPASLSTYFKQDSAGNITATDIATTSTTTGDGDGDDLVTVTEMNKDLKAALKAWAATATAVASAESDGSTLKFVGLPYGYYVITTSQGEAAITVDSTNPNATIVDKNSTTPANLTKTVNDDDVNIGDTVTYTVSFTTSNYDGAGEDADQIISYTIEDTLPDFLTDVKVTSIIVDEDANTETTEDQFNVTDQFDGNGKITIDWVKTEDNGSKTSLYKNGAKVVITYTATVTSKAVIAGAGNTNTVKLTWDTTGGKDYGKLEDSTVFSTYAIALKKVNDKGVALSGATFQFPFYVKAKDATVTDDGVYIYAGTTAGEGLTNEITTSASGEIVIKGVASGEYSITETKAPDGYNKLVGDITVPAQKMTTTETNVTKYLDADGVVTDEVTNTVVTYKNTDLAATVTFVVNKSGVELPSTGGMGTTVFYVIGAVLMLGAVVVLVSRKRMAA